MKKIIISIFSLLGTSLLSVLIFTNVLGFSEDIKIASITSKNIFFDSPILNRTTIVYKSNSDISSYAISSLGIDCNIKSQYLGKRNELYFYEVLFLDNECKNKNLTLKDKDKKVVAGTSFALQFYKNFDLYNTLIDLSDIDLLTIQENINSNITKLSLYNNLKPDSLDQSLNFLMKKRLLNEIEFQSEIVSHIIDARKEKYGIPIVGRSLPTKNVKLPNANRGYREGFTDGIHHSWDIDAPVGTSIVSLDDALVVRVVNNWNWGSLGNIRKGTNLSQDDLLRNLDILRGNQVWLKTMKGELVMYAHLDSINAQIKEGYIIKKGTVVGNVGVSGVPEQGYTDSHLDFSVNVNPYLQEKAGKYDIEDYMRWDWKMKGQTMQYIIDHQYDIFEKN